jgi:hypothetical protein
MFVILQDSANGSATSGYGGYRTPWCAKATQMKRIREGESSEQADKSPGTPRKVIKKA